MTSEREQELLQENAQLRQENALLKQKVDLLIKRIFGAGSEKMDPRQLELLLGGGAKPGKSPEPVSAAEAPRRSKAPSSRRKRPPPHRAGQKELALRRQRRRGQRGAILYTIIENCRRQSIDPYAYLREVLTKLPTLTNRQIKDWTPAAYARRLHEQQHAALRRAS
ncbi:MAG: transposase domain-containing protein [Verrucomicrobiota bacterium]